MNDENKEKGETCLFRFNKNRKVSDKWSDGDKSKFKTWCMQAENYLHTGHADIAEVLEWSAKQKVKITLKLLDEDGDYVPIVIVMMAVAMVMRMSGDHDGRW